jgi:hypothetical protein
MFRLLEPVKAAIKEWRADQNFRMKWYPGEYDSNDDDDNDSSEGADEEDDDDGAKSIIDD